MSATVNPRSVLDFVDTLGADPSGETTSDNTLAALRGLGGPIAVIVPPGRYRFSGQPHEVATNGDTGGIRLIAGQENAVEVETDTGTETTARPQFVAPGGYDGIWLDFRTDTLLERIDIDRRAYGAGPQIRFWTPTETTLRDIRVYERDDSDALTGTLFEVESAPTATVRFERVRAPTGAWWTRETATSGAGAGRQGVHVGPAHRGSLVLEDCEFSQFAGFGVDAVAARGSVLIQGGRYANSNQGQLLVGGPADRIDGATIGVNLGRVTTPYREFETYPRIEGIDTAGYTACRGIVVDRHAETNRLADEGDSSSSSTNSNTTTAPAATSPDVSIEDADVRIESFHDRQGDTALIEQSAAVWGTSAARRTTLRKNTILVDVDDVPGVRFDAPADPDPDDLELEPGSGADRALQLANRVDLRNTSIGGLAENGTAIVLAGRPASSIRGGCIARPGQRRHVDDRTPDAVELRTTLRRVCPRR